MLKRKIENVLNQWFNTDYGLLIDGARQIGKTYSIHHFICDHFNNVIEINLMENKNAVNVLKKSIDADDFILRLSTLINKKLIEKETVIFIDEIQEFKDYDIITMMKFLVNKKKYRFIVSGSLLGVQQYGINSWPEGYMMLEKMYPLDFEEFLWACNVDIKIISIIKNCFNKKEKVPDYIHDKCIDLFKKYLLIGGMPKAVDEFIKTNDINAVNIVHKTIEQYTTKDVSKYAKESDKILIQEMYDLIPSELNSQSKRFKLSDLPSLKRNEDLGLSFGWFTKAGVAIPTYNVNELSLPLMLNSDRRLVKLYFMDTGLLTYKMMDKETKSALIDGIDMNYGAIYENAVAQSLICKGYDNLFYFSKHGIGEIDFITCNGANIIPIEVKSGKNYKFHSAINNVISKSPFNKYINYAYVLCNNNVSVENKIIYLPIYMCMCL